MLRDVNQKCLIIYYVSTAFSLYCIVSNLIRDELIPVTAVCTLNVCISTALTYGRFRNSEVQKYAIALLLGICLTVYGYEKGSLAYSQGTFLAVVCLCSLHLDIKLNLLIGGYIAVVYAFFMLFLPQEMYSDSVQFRNVLLRLTTIYIGQVMIVMLISHIALQQRQNQAKTRNAETLLKIVEEKRKEALAANNAKSDFLANMSHEIRTPMNAIIGISEIVLRSNISDDVRERLLCIKDSSKTLVNIVNEILDFSKIEAGKFEIIPASYQITSVISDISTIGKLRVEDAPIAFVLDIDTQIPFKLLGDEIRIRQIMMNLVTNATKFTNAGTITLKVWSEPREGERIMLNISVADTGIGIKETDIARLFSSFMQVDTRKNRLVEGSGLGLAITKKLAELMQGSISVQSEYGQGSVFTVRIPQGILDATPIGEFSPLRRDEDTVLFRPSFMAPGAKVLVVDDNAVNIAVAKGIMAPYGMEIVTATSAQECFDLMPRHDFHMIFMDHMMPVMDGLEATKILRAEGVTVPIIALTANAIRGAKDMYMASGFDAYISKPIEMRALDKILGEFLPKHFVVSAPAQPAPSAPLASPAVQAGAPPVVRPEISLPVQPVIPPTVAGAVSAVRFPANMCRAILAEGRKKFPLLERSWQGGDWRNYAIEVHALKTTAKICHEEELFRLAKEQEAAEREGNYAALVSGFPRVRTLYADLLQRVAAQHEKDTEAATSSQPAVGARDFVGIARAMLHYAQDFDMDGLEGQVGRLRRAAASPDQRASVARICTALELLEYDAVCAELRRMLEMPPADVIA